MKLAGTLDKLLVIVWRDTLTALRYRTGFLIIGIGVIAELAAFYYLARAVGPGFRPQGMGYFPFLLVGTGFYTFLMLGMNSFLTSVQEAQQTGSLEVLMTTSTPAPVLMLLSAVSAFSRNLPRILLYFTGGFLLIWRTHSLHPNVLACLAVLFLSMLIAVAIGVLASALQVAMHKGSAVIWLLGSVTWFMTGALFPVTALPKPLWLLSRLIPITHCLDGMRLSLLQAGDSASLGREIGVLAAFSAVLLPASLWLFRYALQRARLQGTLSFY